MNTSRPALPLGRKVTEPCLMRARTAREVTPSRRAASATLTHSPGGSPVIADILPVGSREHGPEAPGELAEQARNASGSRQDAKRAGEVYPHRPARGGHGRPLHGAARGL